MVPHRGACWEKCCAGQVGPRTGLNVGMTSALTNRQGATGKALEGNQMKKHYFNKIKLVSGRAEIRMRLTRKRKMGRQGWEAVLG